MQPEYPQNLIYHPLLVYDSCSLLFWESHLESDVTQVKPHSVVTHGFLFYEIIQ